MRRSIPRLVVAARVLQSARSVLRTYLTREEGVAYDWRIDATAAVAVGAPACLGVALGDQGAGILIAMSAWLIMRSRPRGDTRERIVSLTRRGLLMALGTAAGTLTGGWLALPIVTLAAFAAPLRGIGPFPALCVVIGAQTPGRAWWATALLFLLGALFATALLLIPYLGGRHDPPRPRTPCTPLGNQAGAALASLRAAALEGTPRFRHAVRLGVSVTAGYVLLTATGLAGGQLLVIGIVVTLRPSWRQTTNRIIKRVGGTILGCIAAAGLLAMAGDGSPYLLMTSVAILSGLGQPLRRINYGFWPVFSSPVALLMTDTTGTIGWSDALQRGAYTAVGATLAALATLLIWPTREQRRIPDQLATVLTAHADMLRRVAIVMALPQCPAERLHTRTAAESAVRKLDQTRRRVAQQPRPPQDLLAALRDFAASSEVLRAATRAALTHARLPQPDVSRALHELGGRLDHIAEDFKLDHPDTPPPDASPSGPGATVALATLQLIRQATNTAALALTASR